MQFIPRVIGAKFVSNWERNMLYNKSQQTLHAKRISLLTGLKVSSLACKGVLYRIEHNAKGKSHGIEFWKSWNTEMKHISRQSSKSRWKKWD